MKWEAPRPPRRWAELCFGAKSQLIAEADDAMETVTMNMRERI